MLVLHAHWQPPSHAGETGAVLFWAETSARPGEMNPAPLEREVQQHGSRQRRPRIVPRTHPFIASREELMALLGGGMPGSAMLRLPTWKGQPLSSPQLVTEWEDLPDSPPALTPWTVEGLSLPAAAALQGLVNLPSLAASSPGLELGDDARFYQLAAGLAMEALTSGKMLPTVVEASQGVYHARWTVLLDAPGDAARLAMLEMAMPPICSASFNPAAIPEPPPPSPRALLESFLNSACDGLMRLWGSGAAPHIGRDEKDPPQRWLASLFSFDPRIDASRRR